MGGEKLFLDTQDFRVFMFYLYIYTSPTEEVIKRFSDLPMRLREKTLNEKLEIMAYVLLTNHFHLVIRQREADGMPHLMKQVVNGYTAYFNQKYRHRGPVFSGRYKAIEINGNAILDVVRHVHNEPSDKNYEWSSYSGYRGGENFLHCDKKLFLDTFGTLEGVVKFHDDKSDYDKSLLRIKSPVCLPVS